MEEQLSPTCTFALSVLMEHAQDANAVPEEALEAARQHIATCEHCAQAAQSVEVASDAPRKARRATRAGSKDAAQSRATNAPTASEQVAVATAEKLGAINCQQCRVLLPEYAVALVSKQNVAQLYPEVQAHLALCDTGCLALLEKLTRKDVLQEPNPQATQPRNPFSAMLVGFWRGGPVTLSGRVLSYGMLILLLVAGSLGVYLGYSWHARYRESSAQIDPDGAGLSDGLKVFDACNGAAFQSKLAAARALREKEIARAQSLYDDALRTVQADTTGCNGAEAAIYRQNLSIRQSGRPYGIVIVAFDSGPSSNVDRHTRYAAYTQELIGISIGQQQYNAVQEKTAGAPLLYIVLANTAGSEAGAEQLSRAISTMAKGANGQVPGLLFNGPHPLLGVLGTGPGNLTQIMLPTMCRDGVPLIAPTAMERFISDQLTQVSFYRHCAPGFAFMRFSPDTVAQGNYGATYAYDILKVHDAAIFYNPDNPASGEAAQSFANSFSHLSKASIVARETVITSQLVDSQGEGQHAVQLALADALRNNPQVIFAPLDADDAINLAQAIAKLPTERQPTLLVGGGLVQPPALQQLAQWARTQQLALPHIYIVAASAARPPIGSDWQKQFYAVFCTLFAHPGSYCSGAAILEQGALLFGDGIALLTKGLGTSTNAGQLPDARQLIKRLKGTSLAGVSGEITLQLRNDVLITNTKATPVILALQQDGSIQVTG